MPIFKKEDMNIKEGSAPGLEECDIVDAAQGSHSLKIGEVTIAPNTRLPRHIHTNTEEAIVILDGTLDVLLGSERRTVGPGHTILAPAGTTHGFVNRYDAPARLLFIFPMHNPDLVQASVPGATSGFFSASITQVRDAAKYSSTLWEFQRVTSPI